MSRQVLLNALAGLRQHYKHKMGEEAADPAKGAPGIDPMPRMEGGASPTAPKLTITIGSEKHEHAEPDAHEPDDDEDDY